MLLCVKCGGRILIDRAYSNYGHIELSCLKCGKHWELHRDTILAKILSRLERRRELGWIHENLLLSQ